VAPRGSTFRVLIWGSEPSFRSFVMRGQSKWLVAKEKKKKKNFGKHP
jgi:hypothetical protein